MLCFGVLCLVGRWNASRRKQFRSPRRTHRRSRTREPYNRTPRGVRTSKTDRHQDDVRQKINTKDLESLSMDELSKLQRFIKDKQEKQLKSKKHVSEKPENTVKEVKAYQGLIPNAKEVLCTPVFFKLSDMVVSSDDLFYTDFIHRYRKQFDSMDRETLDDLIMSRTVSINNSPGLQFTVLLAEETCTYFAVHAKQDIPLNVYDPYASTVTCLKHNLFSKINVGKLSCILSDGTQHVSGYELLKKIAAGNKYTYRRPDVRHESRFPDIRDIRQFQWSYFQHPFQKALYLLATLERIICDVRTNYRDYRMSKTDRYLQMNYHDKHRVFKSYTCGKLTELVKRGFCEHRCHDVACKRRATFALSIPSNLGVLFCPPLQDPEPYKEVEDYFNKSSNPTETNTVNLSDTLVSDVLGGKSPSGASMSGEESNKPDLGTRSPEAVPSGTASGVTPITNHGSGSDSGSGTSSESDSDVESDAESEISDSGESESSNSSTSESGTSRKSVAENTKPVAETVENTEPEIMCTDKSPAFMDSDNEENEMDQMSIASYDTHTSFTSEASESEMTE